MAVTPRANGIRSRASILARSLELTAARGLHAATIGALAAALGMSKSGVFAHFGSKDALDLAVIDAAASAFARDVMAPADAAPPGIARVAALCEGFLAYAAAPAGAGSRLTPDHPAFGLGTSTSARARLDGWRDQWLQALAGSVEQAIARQELSGSAEAAQVVFELDGVLEAAARTARWQPAAAAVSRARMAIDRVLLAERDA